MGKLELDFYYGSEAEQFTFYRLPKALITDNKYKELSCGAKLLYGLMIDRMSLSKKNGWLDEQNRVYIKYTKTEVCKALNISPNTAKNLINELNDIGLIEIIKVDGKASIIYVKNFISNDKTVKGKSVKTEEDCVNEKDYNETCKSSVILNQFKKCTGSEIEEVQKMHQINEESSFSSKIEPPLDQKLNPNKNITNKNLSETNQIHQSIDWMEQIEAYIKLIRDNIDYDVLMSDTNWEDRGMYNELYNIICDMVCVPRDFVRIAGEEYPYYLVQRKFLKLRSGHLQYVIMCMRNNATKINNIKAYLTTALYNAPDTINNFYNAEVNHDLYGTD